MCYTVYMYINTNTCMYIFKKNMLFIYNIKYNNIHIYMYIHVNILEIFTVCVCVFIYT